MSVTLIAGLFQLAMRVCQLGVICTFMSMPFIVAFLTASATQIIVAQVCCMEWGIWRGWDRGGKGKQGTISPLLFSLAVGKLLKDLFAVGKFMFKNADFKAKTPRYVEV